MCGAANMYLKGEGTAVNASRAIELYENATSTPGGSVRALNGLGYIYFFGQVVPKNHSRAFGYFMEATENLATAGGDSLFNAGYCLEHGLGVPRNVTRAVELYTTAATHKGNFDSISALGKMYIEVHRVTACGACIDVLRRVGHILMYRIGHACFNHYSFQSQYLVIPHHTVPPARFQSAPNTLPYYAGTFHHHTRVHSITTR